MGCSLFAKLEFAQEILKAVKIARKAGAKISFDPNIRRELMGDERIAEIVKEILNYTNVFLPGLEELMMLTGQNTEESAVRTCFEMKKTIAAQSPQLKGVFSTWLFLWI